MKQIKNVVLLLFVSVLLISCSMKSISYKITNGYGKWASQIANETKGSSEWIYRLFPETGI